MLADSQYDSVGPTQFQQMNETFEDDFLAQLTSAAGVPSAPRSFSFDESVQETLRLWRQDPDTLEQAFRAPRNAANAQNWISNHLFDSQFNNEAQVALALEMRTSPFRNYGKWARLMHTVQRPAMVSLLIEQVEPQVIEGISSKIMESGFLEDDIQLLRELTSPQNGRSHVDWNPFVHQLLSAIQKDVPSIPKLGLLANLCREPQVRELIRASSSVSKPLYKKLSSVIADDDERKVGLSLTIFAWLAFESNIGQKIFSPDNLTETFKLVFTAMSSEDSELRIIFLDLADILFSKPRVKQSLDEFGQETWGESTGFPWCVSENPQVFGMLNSLRMHHAFDNLTTISLTKFHLVKKACKFITSSNEACQFLEAMMANENLLSKVTSSILKALFNLPSDTLLNDSNHFLSLTNTIINVRHLENYILQDEKTLLQSKIATFGRDMSPMLFVFYAKLSFKTLGVNSLDQYFTHVASILKESRDAGDIVSVLHHIKYLEMAPLLDRLASFILYGSKNDTPSKHMVVKHSADSALQVAQIEGLELKLSAALENFQAVLTVKDELCAGKIATVTEGLQARVRELENQNLTNSKESETRISELKRAKESATQKYDELVAEHGKLKEREIRTNTELDKMMKEFKNKESENGRLTALLAKRDQEVHVLKQKVDDLEDTIGDQEVEHDEMVAKLAQSLDVLAKRKPRTAKRPAKPAAPINIDSLDEHFQNASLSGI